MNRFVLGSVLVTCLFVLMSYHAVNHELYETYPGNGEVISGVEGAVSVCGTVVDSSDEAFTLRLTHESARKVIKVVSPVSVANGDKVEVLGVIQGDELIPEEMIVSKKWAHHAIYLRSLLGFALVLFVFARYWTFDRRSLRFTTKRKQEETGNA
jgi:hypothetical protein